MMFGMSLRRGSETCGDIDVIITRSVEDGKTHAGEYIHIGRSGSGDVYGSWVCDLLSMGLAVFEQVLRRNYGKRAMQGGL